MILGFVHHLFFLASPLTLGVCAYFLEYPLTLGVCAYLLFRHLEFFCQTDRSAKYLDRKSVV